MKKLLILSTLLATFVSVSAQKYMTRTGHIHFKSNAKVDDGVEAHNNEVGIVINGETGEIAIQLLVKGFHFEKALMEEHFNENYMESVKFPKSTFKGTIVDFNKIDKTKNGTHTVKVTGTMLIHGVENPVTQTGTIEIKDGKIYLKSKFKIACADYKIEIPSLVADKVAKEMDVDIDAVVEPIKK